jgi:hypothetical protein
MKKKTMIVLGDSHMTPSRWDEWRNTHFSEIIAEKLNYDIIHYGKGGMSNGGIAISLHTALNEGLLPELILIGTTNHDRIEWPYGPKGCRYPPSIRDIKYHAEVNLTHNLPTAGNDPRIVSAGLMEVTRHIELNLDSWEPSATSADDPCVERLDALKKYFEFIYDQNLKRFMDLQLIYSMYHKLHVSPCKFIICRDPLNVYSESRCDLWLDKKNYAWDDISYIVRDHWCVRDPGYHTDPPLQVEIAELLMDKYIPNL